MTSDPSIQLSDLQAFIKRVELSNVVAQELHAIRHSGQAASHVKVEIESGVAPGKEQVNYKYVAACKLVSTEGNPVADMKVGILATFSISPGEEVPEALLDAFGTRIAVMTTYPYLRQYVNDLAGRIGLVGFNLGLLKQGDDAPVFFLVDPAAT